MPNNSSKIAEPVFKSRLSFRPLLDTLRKNVDEGNPSAKLLYGDLLARFDSIPELRKPLQNFNSETSPHNELIGMLLTTLFPPAISERESLYAVAIPFTFHTIFSSHLFQQMFLRSGTRDVKIPDDNIHQNLTQQKLRFAYQLILKTFFGHDSQDTSEVIYPFTDANTGILKYFQLDLDKRFVSVVANAELPKLPAALIPSRTNSPLPINELMRELPLENFVFEGLVIIKIKDVTEQQIISQVKNMLLGIHTFTDDSLDDRLKSNMQSLLGIRDIRVGITPFFQLNNHYVFSATHNCNSIIYKHSQAVKEKDEISKHIKRFLSNYDQPVVIEELGKKEIVESETLKLYHELGVRSLILCPLKDDGHLLGLLEIMSDVPGTFNKSHLLRIGSIVPLFIVAAERAAENLDNRIDKVIKENFTAIQPAVEWKFTEAAFSYITGSSDKIERVGFSDVYPLYGCIDIRNSSVDRMQAIQLDLVEQLHMVRDLVERALSKIKFPLLESIAFKTDKYINSITGILLSEDELQVYEFLQTDVAEIFHRLAETQPSLKSDIDHYFSLLNPQKNLIYHHRQHFDESILRVNESLADFIDHEQDAAQRVYPHYFERYVTDGVDFNIYIGQSITPLQKFDELYLRNLKIWQLEILAKAAIMVKELENNLSHLLQSTQLILAHSIPISISFRTSERKFDVDGAYNSRYEIIKKRIDKVRIKGTKERLTQPGKIAIVYSLPKEASEYEEYIEFLQTRKLLKQDVEKLELEELQGVIGLKALRVGVNFENSSKDLGIELSSLTSGHLLAD